MFIGMRTGTASSAPRTGRARGLALVLAALGQAVAGCLAARRASPPPPVRAERPRFSRCRFHNNAML